MIDLNGMKQIFIALGLILLSLTACSNHEVKNIENKLEILTKELDNKEKMVHKLISELDASKKDLMTSKGQINEFESKYEAYLLNDDVFSEYVENNPIDAKYKREYEEMSREEKEDPVYQAELENSYERLWQIEMDYAVYRLKWLLDDRAWEDLIRSQESFKNEIRDYKGFLFSVNTRIENQDFKLYDKSKNKVLYRNKTFELLRIIYHLENKKLPKMLFQDYSEDAQTIKQSTQKIKERFSKDIEILSAFEHRVSQYDFSIFKDSFAIREKAKLRWLHEGIFNLTK